MSVPSTSTSAPRASLPLAWMGWKLQMPSAWRPLRFEGNWQAGAVVVGDGGRALFQLKWRRLHTKRFNPAKWALQRARRQARKRVAQGNAPRSPAFADALWVQDPDGRRPTQWWAADTEGNVAEVVVNVDLPLAAYEIVTADVLPSVAFRPATAALQVAVFGAWFEAPAGFRQAAAALKLGDIAVKLEHPRSGDVVTLRQVYPADLALGRRSLQRWLELWPFKGHRVWRSSEPTEEWTCTRQGREVSGYRLAGSKRLPWPLGALAPFQSLAAGCHDEASGRLYLAAHDAVEQADETMLRTCLEAMAPLLDEPAGEMQ